MPTNPSTTDDNTDFVLKHRVAGAAFLLFFGALVLPWVLGPPNQPGEQTELAGNGVVTSSLAGNTVSESQRISTAVQSDDELSAQSIEDELLSAIDDELQDTPESVYISKITPADGKKDLFREKSATNSNDSASSTAVPTTTTTTATPAEKKVEPKPAIVKAPDTKTTPSTTNNTATPNVAPSKNTQKPETSVSESKPQTKPEANKIDVGWVVQVGVFTDKNGASKVVDDLSSKGFKPSTSTVDTNRGKGTGTRVWLGPFAQRVEAAKTKARLTERTGEPGFIRAYP